MKAVLRNRSLVIMGISEAVSNTGSWITMMAVLSLIVFRAEGGVVQSSLIYLVGLLPTLLFSPAAGWLCDRFDRKWLMIISELLSGLVVSGIIFVERVEWIYFLLGLQAVTTSLITPARQSSVPQVVERSQLTQANALLQQISSLTKIAAPMLAGGVLSILSPHQAVILDVVSFIFSAVILSFLPSLHPQHAQQPVEKQPVFSSAFAPLLDVLKKSSALRLLFTINFLAIIAIIAVDILAAIFTRDALQGGEKLLGFQIGLIGLGTLLGAASLMAQKKPSNPWMDILLGMTLLAAVPAAMAIGYWLPSLGLARGVAYTACLLGGFGMGRNSVQTGTLLQTISPAHVLGRVSSVFQSVIVGGQLIGILLTPLLVPLVFSVPTYFGLVSGIILAVALLGILPRGRALNPAAQPFPAQE